MFQKSSEDSVSMPHESDFCIRSWRRPADEFDAPEVARSVVSLELSELERGERGERGEQAAPPGSAAMNAALGPLGVEPLFVPGLDDVGPAPA